MIEIVASVFCIITTIVSGIVFLANGLTEKEKGSIILGSLLIVIGFVATVENLSDWRPFYVGCICGAVRGVRGADFHFCQGGH